MGQLITTLDEAGVNELFKKAWNQAGPIGPFEFSRNVGLNGANASAKLKFKLVPLDFDASTKPIDLLRTTPGPQLTYGGLRILVDARVEVSASVGGFGVSEGLDADATVVLAGNGNSGRENQQDYWQPWLELDATGTTVTVGGSVNQIRDAVRSRLQGIDASPWPGNQPLPAALIADAVNAVGQAYALVQAAASQHATSVLRNFTNGARVRLGFQIPKRFDLPVPGGGSVQAVITALDIAINGGSVTLKATFS